MHTFLYEKHGAFAGKFQIGIWIGSKPAFVWFQLLFVVDRLNDAITSVNILNGGNPVADSASTINMLSRDIAGQFE